VAGGGHPVSTAAMAGLPGRGAWVLVGPPLSFKPASFGFTGFVGFGPPVMLPLGSPPMKQPSTVPMRFDPLETIGPKQSNFELAASIVPVSVAVVPASVHRPPPYFAEFLVMVS